MKIVKHSKTYCARPGSTACCSQLVMLICRPLSAVEPKFDMTLLLAPCDARFPDARAAVAIVRLISKWILPEGTTLLPSPLLL